MDKSSAASPPLPRSSRPGNIVVYGAGGHAKAVIDVVEKQGIFRILGVLDDRKPPGSGFYGYEVLGGMEWLHAQSSLRASTQGEGPYQPSQVAADLCASPHEAGPLAGIIVAVGDNWTRSTLAAYISEAFPHLPFVSAVHPSAQIAKGAIIGDGTVVMAGSIVGSDSVIGRHNVMYPLTSLDHDSATGDFVSFAPKSATGGGVKIGSCTAIAVGATVAHAISIGDHVVIGAGATVLSDIPSFTVAYGTPARVIRSRTEEERYL